MPPKKKAPAKDEVTDKELLQKAEAELVSLRRLLELKTFEGVEARAQERSWRERAEAAEAALEQAKLDMADIKADITHQHATQQEQIDQRMVTLESCQSELQGQLKSAQQLVDALKARNEQLTQRNEDQAVVHQQQVEGLHRQFAAMLKDTLEQMRAQLEEQHYSVACRAGCG